MRSFTVLPANRPNAAMIASGAPNQPPVRGLTSVSGRHLRSAKRPFVALYTLRTIPPPMTANGRTASATWPRYAVCPIRYVTIRICSPVVSENSDTPLTRIPRFPVCVNRVLQRLLRALSCLKGERIRMKSRAQVNDYASSSRRVLFSMLRMLLPVMNTRRMPPGLDTSR